MCSISPHRVPINGTIINSTTMVPPMMSFELESNSTNALNATTSAVLAVVSDTIRAVATNATTHLLASSSGSSGVSASLWSTLSGAASTPSNSVAVPRTDLDPAYILCMIQQNQRQLLDAAANVRSNEGASAEGNRSSAATAATAVVDFEELYARG